MSRRLPITLFAEAVARWLLSETTCPWWMYGSTTVSQWVRSGHMPRVPADVHGPHPTQQKNALEARS